MHCNPTVIVESCPYVDDTYVCALTTSWVLELMWFVVLVIN